MPAVVRIARAQARAHLRSWVALVLVIGLGGGVVLAAWSGGRRTDSAVARFGQAERAADLLIFGRPDAATRPEVAAATTFVQYTPDEGLAVVAPTTPLGTAVNRFKFLSGRRARAADEAVVPIQVARERHLHAGSHLALHFGGEGGERTTVDLRVVGVEVSPVDLPPNVGVPHIVFVTPAFAARYHDQLEGDAGTLLRLRRGTDLADFEKSLEATGEPGYVVRQSDLTAAHKRSFHLQALALWLVAGLLALVLAVVVGQLIARQLFLDSLDHPTLRSLGASRTQLFVLGLMRAAVLGAAGAVLAVVVAAVLSPLTPLGDARLAEPHPGFAVDATVLVLGAVGIAVTVIAIAALPAWRQARVAAADEERLRAAALARAAARRPMPPTAAIGVSMALEPGRGRTAVPVRTSLVGVTVALAALAGAVTFGASLSHLLATPKLYGWAWDAHAEGEQPVDVAALQGDPDVAAFAVGASGIPVQVGRVQTEADAFTSVKGRVEPVVTSGRAPQGPDEIMLGSRTLRSLHVRLGQDVTAGVVTSPLTGRFRVVGEGVVTTGPSARFGQGVALTAEGMGRLAPDTPANGEANVRFRPGVSQAEGIADLKRRLGESVTVSGADKPTDLLNFGRVQNLPVILAGLLAALAAATLAQTLLTSIRRRRQDLAVLKTLGLVPGQVGATVAWQSSTVAAIALVVGLPLGVAAGRWGWSTFADQLGTIGVPVTPVVTVLLIIPAAVLLANVVAAVPARLAGRTPPATVLRAE